MNKSELISTLAELELHPSRRLGQNFLVDGNTRRLIAAAVAPRPDRLLIEIGPGTGSLTAALLDAGANLLAIEYDARLAEFLERTFGAHPRFALRRADAARVDYDRVAEGRPWAVCGNLPYAAGSAIVARILGAVNLPTDLTFLVQKDMAERLAAAPGSKTYGSLSVLIQAGCRVQMLREVPPTVFWPQPQVESALIRAERRENAPGPDLRRRLEGLLQTVFQQRRKMLRKTMAGSFAHPDPVLERLGICVSARPEQVTVEQFLALAAELPARPDS